MEEFTNRVKSKLKEEGADLVGIAPIESFKDVIPEQHPSSIFPEAKAVIVAGFFISRGLVRGIEEGTVFNYWSFVEPIDYWMTWFFHRVTGMFEEKGFEVVPIFPYLPYNIMNQGIKVAVNKPQPNIGVDVELAAVRAGLGEIGYGGFFLTPEFGPLQKFMAIITDAPLISDSVLEDSICDECMACVEICPLKAISDKEYTLMKIGEKEMKIRNINYNKCKRCQNGAFPSRFPDAPPDRIPALCGRECLVHLEKEGILKHKWVNSFRKRKPWIVVDGDFVDTDETRLSWLQ